MNAVFITRKPIKQESRSNLFYMCTTIHADLEQIEEVFLVLFFAALNDIDYSRACFNNPTVAVCFFHSLLLFLTHFAANSIRNNKKLQFSWIRIFLFCAFDWFFIDLETRFPFRSVTFCVFELQSCKKTTKDLETISQTRFLGGISIFPAEIWWILEIFHKRSDVEKFISWNPFDSRQRKVAAGFGWIKWRTPKALLYANEVERGKRRSLIFPLPNSLWTLRDHQEFPQTFYKFAQTSSSISQKQSAGED